MTLEQEGLNTFLIRTIATFEQDRGNAGILRRLAEESPAQFLVCGMKLLLRGADTAGFRYLTAQILKMPQLFTVLCDPWKLSQDEALRLSARLIRSDASFDTRLAQRLPGRHGIVTADTLVGEAAGRALDILDQVSVGRRVIPILNHLTSHPDKKISSKAALLLGKRVQNVAWAKRITTESPDARIRANAIESVWGSKSPQVVEMFRECLADRDHRVVGNCIIGLHLAGEADVSRIVEKFAADEQHDFRMAAAWTMGKIGDGVFTTVLSALLKDTHPAVRRAALRALHGIRQVEKSAEDARAQERQKTEPVETLDPSEFDEDTVPIIEVDARPGGAQGSSGKRIRRYIER